MLRKEQQRCFGLGVFDVDTGKLIEQVADEFRKDNYSRPKFADFVKTGMSREKHPQNQNWYFVRMASVLYRLYKEGPLGTGSLRTYYGGRKNRGTKRHHFYKASGKIIRTCLQELEKQGLVKKENKGRSITGKGQKLLNEKAKIVAKSMAEESQRKSLREEKKGLSDEERKVKEELRKIDQHKAETQKEKKQEKHEKKSDKNE